MDQTRGQRLHDTRARYLVAMRELNRALIAFDNSGTPMDPGPDPDRPYPWTHDQVRIVTEAAQAFAAVVETRRAWDGLRRPTRSP